MNGCWGNQAQRWSWWYLDILKMRQRNTSKHPRVFSSRSVFHLNVFKFHHHCTIPIQRLFTKGAETKVVFQTVCSLCLAGWALGEGDWEMHHASFNTIGGGGGSLPSKSHRHWRPHRHSPRPLMRRNGSRIGCQFGSFNLKYVCTVRLFL